VRSPADRALELGLLDAEGRERLPVEGAAHLEVANRQREVVDEDRGRDGEPS
jgi:hypothetical protein